MPYQNWEDVGDIVEILRICKVKDVVDSLQDLRYLITKRHIVQHSAELVKPNVYSCEKYTRLPDNEHFVFDGDGRWSFYLDKLFISVRAIYHTVSKSKKIDHKKLQELEEQSLDYIHKILNLMYNLDEVFTRSTIEKKYSLKWADDNEGEIIHKVKAKGKSSSKFRKSVISCNNGDALRKLLQQEIDECMQSDDNEGENIHKVKAKRKSSSKFRKSVILCNNGDALRKLLQQEIDECMQSDDE